MNLSDIHKAKSEELYSDEKLVQLLHNGEKYAFNLLYKKYWTRLYVMANNRLRDSELAKEVVQDLFVDLWLKRTHLDIKNFSSYIFTSLKYSVLDCIRRSHVKEKYVSEIKNANLYFEYLTDNAVAFNELHDLMESEINKLPEKCREVFELRKNQNYSLKEIASLLNISEKTVENHITKALRILKTNLKDFVTLILVVLSNNF